MTHVGCLLWWASKIQTLAATYTGTTDNIALSNFSSSGYKLSSSATMVYCKTLDNLGTLEIAQLTKMHPHTKSINVIYHHFHEYVILGIIAIYLTKTGNHFADTFTKPLIQNTYWHRFVVVSMDNPSQYFWE